MKRLPSVRDWVEIEMDVRPTHYSISPIAESPSPMKRLLPLLLLAPLCLNADPLTDTVYAAYKASEPGPVLSHALTEADPFRAYLIQSELVARLVHEGAVIGGYKAALTSSGAQQKMGVSEPAAGVLFKSGLLHSGVEISARSFNKLMVETELGYFMGSRITNPIEDLDTLKTLVSHVAPAIEVADAAFGTDHPLKVFDIIASNAGARSVIVGAKVPIAEITPNSVKAIFYRGEDVISEGEGKDTLGDQWEVLRWVINTMIKSGHTIEPGNLIITGSLGAMQPGTPGDYRAVYDGIETLTFTISE